MNKVNYEEVVEALYNNNEGIQNLHDTEFAKEIFKRLDNTISKGDLTDKDLKKIGDVISVLAKELHIVGDGLNKFINQTVKDLREQKNVGNTVTSDTASNYALMKLVEQLSDSSQGKRNSAFNFSNITDKGKQLINPILKNPSKYSLTAEEHRKNLDYFAEKLFKFIKGEEEEEEGKDKKKQRTFIDDLIDSLKASKFIGGAVQDGAKLFGYLLASKLAQFGTWGRALGAIVVALSDTLPKIFWAGVAQIIDVIKTYAIVKAATGQGIGFGAALGTVGKFAKVAGGIGSVIGGGFAIGESAQDFSSGKVGSGILKSLGGLTLILTPILAALGVISGPIVGISIAIGAIATFLPKIWDWLKDTWFKKDQTTEEKESWWEKVFGRKEETTFKKPKVYNVKEMTPSEYLTKIEGRKDSRIKKVEGTDSFKWKYNQGLSREKEIQKMIGDLGSIYPAYGTNKEDVFIEPTQYGTALAAIAYNKYGKDKKGTGHCLTGVDNALLELYGFKTGLPSAYQAAGFLKGRKEFRDITDLFTRNGQLQTNMLPPGSIIVWNKSKGHPYGHVSIASGTGKEISDHIQDQITQYGTSVAGIFYPKERTKMGDYAKTIELKSITDPIKVNENKENKEVLNKSNDLKEENKDTIKEEQKSKKEEGKKVSSNIVESINKISVDVPGNATLRDTISVSSIGISMLRGA